MLVEFSVENYRSIAERQTLSMVASKERILLNSNTFKLPGENLRADPLRGAPKIDQLCFSTMRVESKINYIYKIN